VPPQPDTPTPPAGCTAASSAGGAVNLRSGPGTGYAVLASLPLGQTAQVTGVWTGGSWYVVNVNGFPLWVSSSVVTLSGDCSALPPVAAPANAPLAPTKPPTQPPPIETPEVDEQTDEMPDEPFTPSEPLPLPDLVVSNIVVGQGSPTQLQVTALITNVGETYMSDSFYVSACIDGLCGEQMVSQVIDVNGIASVTIVLNSGTNPGVARTVVVTADSRRNVIETDENNNTSSLGFIT
jgi:hypothetical protein